MALGDAHAVWPFLLQSITIPMPSQCHVLKADPDLAASSSELDKSSLQLWM